MRQIFRNPREAAGHPNLPRPGGTRQTEVFAFRDHVQVSGYGHKGSAVIVSPVDNRGFAQVRPYHRVAFLGQMFVSEQYNTNVVTKTRISILAVFNEGLFLQRSDTSCIYQSNDQAS